MASSFKSKANSLSLDGIQPSKDQLNILFNNQSVVLRKEPDALIQYNGKHNVFIGYDSGKSLRYGNDNVFIGFEAGFHTNTKRVIYHDQGHSSTNLFVGPKAGYQNVNGYSNLYLGYNNSKNLRHEINSSSTDDYIFDNISIGADGSASGASTITLGNRSITNESHNATVIGYDSSNIGENSILMGSKISNTGDNSFIMHSKGGKENKLDNYFNINDVFSGITANVDETYLNFHLDKLELKKIEVTQEFISKNLSRFDTLIVDNSFQSYGESLFNGLSIFNDKVTINDSANINNVNTNNLTVLNTNTDRDLNFILTIDNEESKFYTNVSFIKNQTFSNDTIFSKTYFYDTARFDRDIEVKSQIIIDTTYDLIIANKTFEEYLKNNIPEWCLHIQGDISLSGFKNDITEFGNVVVFSSNIHTQGIESFGENTFEGSTRVQGDLYSDVIVIGGYTELNEIININGDLNVNNALIVTESNILISGSTYFNSNVIFEDVVDFLEAINLQGLTSIGDNDFEGHTRVNGDFLVGNNNGLMDANGDNSYAFEVLQNETFIRNTLNVLDSFIVDEDFIHLAASNIDINGLLCVNDGFMVTPSNIVMNYPLVIGDMLSVENKSYFLDDVTIENDVIMKSNLFIYPEDSSNLSWWSIYSSPTRDEDSTISTIEADLIFKSKNGSEMRFHDNFEDSILNFTGQHRCTISIDSQKIQGTDDLIGKIVSSTGTYKDLYDATVIRVNEAIPVVKVCDKENDKSVFGVISGVEPDQDTSTFSLGHISFILNKVTHCKKAMVNSVGEGGIWVCNINGELENGDFVCSSKLTGYGMRQNSDVRMNYTVAKITCDCDFDLESSIYNCLEFLDNNTVYKKAFVGCIYCC